MKFKFSPYIARQVKDHKKAINFYRYVLGMKFIEEDGNDTYLNSDPINFVYENGGKPGRVFFEFEVASVKKAIALLKKNGCKVTQVYSGKSVMISDPFGMNFHILEK
jgi:catechol 2,3-dioxygenase-like lactoylglutathione lyase family enzyme